MVLSELTNDIVLIVDDSPETLSMLTDMLDRSGMTVLVATSGQKALNLVDTVRPHIILLDAVMPGLDGFETCEALKNEKGLTDVPVIFMTGLNESEHVVRALTAGGVDYVTKPVSHAELIARMRVHLANARKAQAAISALDATGRTLVAVNQAGQIRWVTPQASKLLTQIGMCNQNGDIVFPNSVMEWLKKGGEADASGPDASFVLEGEHDNRLELRLVARMPQDEILLRIIDGRRGSDLERLAETFHLTRREAEVLLWIAHGKSNKDIAEILEMSPRTVNKHLEQIFAKLGVENRTAAATTSVRVLMD